MQQDRERWDARYDGQRPATAAPPDAIAGRSDIDTLIPSTGRAIDIACGSGAQTLWLAERGLEVVALDVSPVALDLLRAAAAASGYAHRIEGRLSDLDDGLPDDLRDVDVIVCQRFRGTGLYSQIVDRLRPGGVAVVTVLSAVGLDGAPGPFHASAGELIDAFSRDDVEIVEHTEAAGAASVVVLRM